MNARKSTAALLALLLALALGACGSSSESATTTPSPLEEFGSAAEKPERAAAAATLHAYLGARAEGDWKAACAELSAAVVRTLVAQPGKGREQSCPKALAELTGAVPPATLRQAADAEVGAMRLEGDRAFLLFRGAEGSHYFLPLVEEGGEWKVSAIAASPLL